MSLFGGSAGVSLIPDSSPTLMTEPLLVGSWLLGRGAPSGWELGAWEKPWWYHSGLPADSC